MLHYSRPTTRALTRTDHRITGSLSAKLGTGPCKMNASRFFRRLGFFGLTLLLVDGVGHTVLADKIALTDYRRLPENQEMGFLRSFIDRLASEKGQTRLVFLGSSPTWGVSIKDPGHTYAASFGQALKQAYPQANVSISNLAARGFLAADLNAVLRATLAQAEGFVIQLNYHTFSPKLLQATPIRHPDLPESLGVQVPADEAKMLGMRPTPALNWNASLRAGLRRSWWFYREREKLALSALGATPESWVYHKFYPEKPSDEASGFEPFYQLKPARQTTIVHRYAENARFEIEDPNIELRFVAKMLAQLKAADKPAVFFIAPINAEDLKFYEVMDWKQYQRNVDIVRKLIEGAGYRLIDINLVKPLPAEDFADISHTLDVGGQAFGPRLWQLSKPAFEEKFKWAKPK